MIVPFAPCTMKEFNSWTAIGNTNKINLKKKETLKKIYLKYARYICLLDDVCLFVCLFNSK